jgi:hypothetical protein
MPAVKLVLWRETSNIGHGGGWLDWARLAWTKQFLIFDFRFLIADKGLSKEIARRF